MCSLYTQTVATTEQTALKYKSSNEEKSMATHNENNGDDVLNFMDLRLSFKDNDNEKKEDTEEAVDDEGELNDILLGLIKNKKEPDVDDFDFDTQQVDLNAKETILVDNDFDTPQADLNAKEPAKKTIDNDFKFDTQPADQNVNENIKKIEDDGFELENKPVHSYHGDVDKEINEFGVKQSDSNSPRNVTLEIGSVKPTSEFDFEITDRNTEVTNQINIENVNTERQEDDERAAAEEEWDTVQTVIPEVQSSEGPVLKKKESSPFVSYRDVFEHLQTSDLKQYKANIKTSVDRKGLSAFKHMLFGPPKLHKDLQDDRDKAFCMAMCQLNNEDSVHVRVLLTLFRKLTGSKFDCPRFGPHWEQIGFQGNDPATDMRGCGFLGLLQLLHLVSENRTAQLARDIFKLSQHTEQNFPFCIMGINITKIVIQALREEVLNKDLNKRKDVFGLLNEYYVSVYYHLYHIWKSQYKTIADTGFVIKDVESFAKKKPHQIIRNLNNYLDTQKQGGQSTTNEQPLVFTSVCDD